MRWLQLERPSTLWRNNLKVYQLNKYLNKYNLLVGVKVGKDDKMKSIISHVLKNETDQARTQAVALANFRAEELNEDELEEYDEENVSDSEDDLVLDDLDESSDEKSGESGSGDGYVILRSGRIATTWKNRFNNWSNIKSCYKFIKIVFLFSRPILFHARTFHNPSF